MHSMPCSLSSRGTRGATRCLHPPPPPPPPHPPPSALTFALALSFTPGPAPTPAPAPALAPTTATALALPPRCSSGWVCCSRLRTTAHGRSSASQPSARTPPAPSTLSTSGSRSPPTPSHPHPPPPPPRPPSPRRAIVPPLTSSYLLGLPRPASACLLARDAHRAAS